MSRAPGEYSGLTAMQAELLSFLRRRDAEGRTPSFQEMMDALGLSSKSGVHRLIMGLEDRGYIRRNANRARDIIVFATRGEPSGLGSATITQLVAELERRGVRIGVVA